MQQSETSDTPQLEIELPPQVIATQRTEIAVTGKANGINFMVAQCPESSFLSIRSSLTQIASMGQSRYGRCPAPEESVRVGNIEGYKFVVKDEPSGAILEAKYLLRVPGGYVVAVISGDVADGWVTTPIETKFEPVLATIRIVGNRPKSLDRPARGGLEFRTFRSGL